MEHSEVLAASLAPEIITENLPEVIKHTKKRYSSSSYKEEKPEYKAMYEYYEKLGRKRSFRKVAKEFGRSIQHVSNVSKHYEWTNRVRKNDSVFSDPVTSLVKPTMDSSRTDIVHVVSEITTILSEMTTLSKSIRKNGSHELSKAERDKMNSLINALAVYGIKIRTPKDLRDMVGTLKDIMQFSKDTGMLPPAQQNTQVNVKEMNLVIKDDD